MALTMADSIETMAGAFKGTGAAIGSIGSGATGAARGAWTTRSLAGPMLHKGIFAGAALGLGISAVGMGLHAIAGDSITEDGPFKSMMKGAFVGAGASATLFAGGHIRGAFTNTIMNDLKTVTQEGGFIGRQLARTGRTLAGGGALGKILYGGAAVGAGAMLINSIISTNFTRPNN
jgi:hypothetical protein